MANEDKSGLCVFKSVQYGALILKGFLLFQVPGPIVSDVYAYDLYNTLQICNNVVLAVILK